MKAGTFRAQRELSVERLIPMTIALVLAAFWVWMFWDMTNNVNLRNTRANWTLAFVLLNVFAAVYYYVVEYRNKY